MGMGNNHIEFEGGDTQTVAICAPAEGTCRRRSSDWSRTRDTSPAGNFGRASGDLRSSVEKGKWMEKMRGSEFSLSLSRPFHPEVGDGNIVVAHELTVATDAAKELHTEKAIIE